LDTKLKKNKINPKISFMIMVISLVLVLVPFNIVNMQDKDMYEGEFYESGVFKNYIGYYVMHMYKSVDEDHSNNEGIDRLASEKNIKYMVVNNKTNKINTNVPYDNIVDFKKNEKGYAQIEGKNNSYNVKINKEDSKYRNIDIVGNKKIDESSIIEKEVELEKNEVKLENKEVVDISMYAVLEEIPKEKDGLRLVYLDYKEVNNMKKNISILAIIGIIMFILSVVISKKKKYRYISEESKIYKIYSNIGLEFKLLFIIIPIVIDNSMDLYYVTLRAIGRMEFNRYAMMFGVSMALKAIYVIMIYMLIQNIKDKRILKKSTIVKIFKSSSHNLRSCIVASRKIGLIKRIILIFVAMIVVNISIFGIMLVLFGALVEQASMIVVGTGAISFIAFVAYTIVSLGYLNEIMEGVKKIESGDINYKIEVKGNDSFTLLAENINGIGNGLDNAIEERMKSEKMKSELITNVSHDLKTPLTSILNYVDLLKKEEVKPEYLNDYIAILDQKSKRLKILIEDLFEAAKATSGSVELNIERIQLNQLLTQSIAEMENKILESNLDMKVNFPKEKVYINADGKKLFRVFENLISNIIKYSLNGTRVYVDMNTDEEYAYINFKNISAYELNFDEGEITERFKRGDISRSEEGSGLGLSIAKGLVELQGGEFTIQTDGDLFKAIVKLELSKE